MGKRVAAVAALVGGALLAVATPAFAQTYPPPVNSITVDDPTPDTGQALQVTLRTCRPRTQALFGLDLVLLGTAQVGRDGVARATIRIPAFVTPGRHAIVGVCVGASGGPLVLRTEVLVGAGADGPIGGTGVPPPSGAGGGGSGGDGGGVLPAMPGLTALRSGRAPAGAPALFEQAGAAIGVAAGGLPGPARGSHAGAGPAPGSGSRSGSGVGETAGPAAGADGLSGLATAARVALGLAALGGVPVALAFSRRGHRATARRRFA